MEKYGCVGCVFEGLNFFLFFIEFSCCLFNTKGIFTIMQDYEENSVNTIFYDNDRRQACVKSAFRLDLYITVTKLHVKSRRKIRLFF